MPQHFSNQKFMKRHPTAKSFFGNKSDSSMLRSWTRLAVGTILFGLETLVDRTRYWERKVEYPTELENNNSVVHIETKKDPSTDVIEYLEPDYPKGLNTAIGFIFDVQER